MLRPRCPEPLAWRGVPTAPLCIEGPCPALLPPVTPSSGPARLRHQGPAAALLRPTPLTCCMRVQVTDSGTPGHKQPGPL